MNDKVFFKNNSNSDNSFYIFLRWGRFENLEEVTRAVKDILPHNQRIKTDGIQK